MAEARTHHTGAHFCPRMDAPDQTTEGRWRPRPLLSFALRATSVLVPAAAGAATAYGFVGVVSMPTGFALIPWGVGLVLL